MGFTITDPLPFDHELTFEEEATMKTPNPELIAAVVAGGCSPELAAILDNDTLQKIADAIKANGNMSNGKKPMPFSETSQQRIRRFSERQNAERGKVAAWAEKHKQGLALVNHTMPSWVRRFEERLETTPALTAAEFCNFKAEKASAFAEKSRRELPRLAHFSEEQNSERAQVYRWACNNADALAALGRTPIQHTRRFEERVKNYPHLTAEEFCNSGSKARR